MIKLNGKIVELNRFPDGCLLIKEYVEKNFDSDRIAEILWTFENNEELVALIYLTRHLQSHGINNIRLVMPYIPNARQDRVKKDEDVFTLKYFAEIINSLKFTSVKVLDPHSNVSEALLDNVIVDSPKNNILKVIDKISSDRNLIMFYPDEGAMKRYSGMIDRPFTYGIKKRDWSSGEIQGLNAFGRTELIEGSDVLIVDDISSRGGTFYYSARALKELGAKDIYLYISHCENTILEGPVIDSGLITRIYTTNSIFTKEHSMIEVIDYE